MTENWNEVKNMREKLTNMRKEAQIVQAALYAKQFKMLLEWIDDWIDKRLEEGSDILIEARYKKIADMFDNWML